ncbi:hypothetical protein ACFL6U_12200 [Planctomycetota bacterium]
MRPFNHNPQFLAQTFSQYVKALVIILLWTIIAMASMAGAYVAMRGLWAGARYILTAIFGV